jgi:hypothetical protein
MSWLSSETTQSLSGTIAFGNPANTAQYFSHTASSTYLINITGSATGSGDTALLDTASLTLTEPAAGASPVDTATLPGGSNYTAGTVSWTDAGGNAVATFENGGVYTASLTLTAAEGYLFDAPPRSPPLTAPGIPPPAPPTEQTVSVSRTYSLATLITGVSVSGLARSPPEKRRSLPSSPATAPNMRPARFPET